MMLKFKFLGVLALPILLAGCSAGDIATAAADAAACRAAQTSLQGLSDAYNAGLVDSGVIAHINSLIGEPVRQLLSTDLAKDFEALGETIASSDPAVSTSEKIDELTADIAKRCAAVGVNFGN